jgi:hypothetical protein
MDHSNPPKIYELCTVLFSSHEMILILIYLFVWNESYAMR